MIIAIQPDDYTNPKNGKIDAFSPRWAEFIKKSGNEVRWVDVKRADIFDQLAGCDGFMWRHGHWPDHRQIARRLLPVIEKELGIEVYPDNNTCWHFDDKITQYYIFTAAGIPTPKTWIWYDYDLALEWISTANYPLVIKLWTGASSENVRLVPNFIYAKMWIDKLFGQGIASMSEPSISPAKSFKQRLRYAAKILKTGKLMPRVRELHKNYVLFQEFLPDNDFDIRVLVIGNRAFGKIRPNRPGDFRASGSGVLDTDPAKIAPQAIKLAFYVSQHLQTQSLAIDLLKRGNEYVVSEISYTSPSWSNYDCPGHWQLKGQDLVWIPGPMWAEEAHVQDFLSRLKNRELERSRICV
jgi:glutathione synthase/RimK-type ligase-like ATP-grasp enzyme